MSNHISLHNQKQLSLFEKKSFRRKSLNYSENLKELLSEDLDFHEKTSNYASHNFHSFPAKFPPQLPKKFILNLTKPGDIVLDPMMGSGTTILEAILNNRNAIGYDIDPLALKLTSVKTTPLNKVELKKIVNRVISDSLDLVKSNKSYLQKYYLDYFDENSRKFIDYWFSEDSILELLALMQNISKIEDGSNQRFFDLLFSAIIITKSGGVSLAFDLGHTRPHRAKVAYGKGGELIFGQKEILSDNPRIKILTKKFKSPIEEFVKKFEQNLSGILSDKNEFVVPQLGFGNAQKLPLLDSSVDLIVTSPPYASNAIDYMRAHKFSLVWSGFSIDELSVKRKSYIGSEDTSQFYFESLPQFTTNIIEEISLLDQRKEKVLKRYYSESHRFLKEMYRVLKPGKAAIVVVGSSVIRGKDIEIQNCLADIGENIGFKVPKIGIRKLDRNRRMMPAGKKHDENSSIQKRMLEEYVIGFLK